MTFPQLMLSARRCLHDIRKSDHSLITLATEDGIRWSASSLVELTQGAVLNCMRSLRALKLNNNINDASLLRIEGEDGSISVAVDTYLVSGITSGFSEIALLQRISVVPALNYQDIYLYVTPEDYFHRARTTYVTTDVEGTEEKVFTCIWNDTTKTIDVLILPMATEEIFFRVVTRRDLLAYCLVGSTQELPFKEIDDLLRDFVKRDASYDSHDLVQYKLIDEAIKMKLMELKIIGGENAI